MEAAPPYLPPQAPEQPPQPRPASQTEKKQPRRFSAAVLAALLLVGLVGGGLLGSSFSYAAFNGRIEDLQSQLQSLPSPNATYVSYPNNTYNFGNNVSLAVLYEQVKESVVVIQSYVPQYNMFGFLVGYASQQGSGFVMLVGDEAFIVTNNHVVEGGINVTVTLANGNSYPSSLVGADALADLAVLRVNSTNGDLSPLSVVSSATLSVGDPVVAVGSPYGLSGTLTTGIISALGRTITESSGNGGVTIADVIQTSTAINPGNSGGPLVNYQGEVVGVTTAVVSNSEGLGFAIPSGTILREVESLVEDGVYDEHPSIQASGRDMNYQVAQAVGAEFTYGWLVESVSSQNGLRGGSSHVAVLGSLVTVGGDIIVGVGGVRVANGDELLSYLERNTLPGQVVDFTVVRDGVEQTVAVTIGKLSA